MTQFPVSEGDLRSVTPRDAVRYLRTRGWVESGRVRYSMQWRLHLGDHEYIALLPAVTELADYPDRMAELLETVSEAEDRSILAVHADMVLTDADTQEITTRPNTPSGTIPLLEGASAVARIRDLILGAATAEVLDEPRLVLPRNKPKRAKEFLSQALLDTTKSGSYIFRIKMPIGAHPSSASSDNGVSRIEPAELPFGRKVAQRLYQSVHAAHEAANLSSATDDLTSFSERTDQGISADLCESLAGLGGESGNGFSIAFGWSPLWSVPNSYNQPRVNFPSHLVPLLSSAAELLRTEDPAPETYAQAFIFGPSSSLTREGSAGGHILVTASQGSTDELLGRQILVRLSADQYDLAAYAHSRHQDLIFRGTVIRQGRRYEMADPTSFVANTNSP